MLWQGDHDNFHSPVRGSITAKARASWSRVLAGGVGSLTRRPPSAPEACHV
jgi:hypothetical protein